MCARPHAGTISMTQAGAVALSPAANAAIVSTGPIYRDVPGPFHGPVNDLYPWLQSGG